VLRVDEKAAEVLSGVRRLPGACAKCHSELLAGAKFWECGEPVVSRASAEPRFAKPEMYTPKYLAEKILTSKNALDGERKQVTVLVADIKGSMELLADRGPEEARKILDPVLEQMMDAVHCCEGPVNQVMGDGIMALFGAPLAHEDHNVRAPKGRLAGLPMPQGPQAEPKGDGDEKRISISRKQSIASVPRRRSGIEFVVVLQPDGRRNRRKSADVAAVLQGVVPRRSSWARATKPLVGSTGRLRVRNLGTPFRGPLLGPFASKRT